jgi:hypothetical protein
VGEIINVPRGRRTADRPDWSVPDEGVARACLTVLAEEGGDLKAAAKRCKDEDIFPATAWNLEQWRDKHHPKIWVDVHSENEKRLEQIAEAQARTNAIRASVAANKAIDRIDGQIADADLVTAAKALDSLTKAQGTSIDAVLKLSGRPVNGNQGGSVADTLRELERLGVLSQPVDGSIEEDDVTLAQTGDQ